MTESYLQQLARQIPTLNFATWMADRRDSSLAAQVIADGRQAITDALSGTPTLIATGARGSQIVPTNSSGVQSYAEIMATVKAVS